MMLAGFLVALVAAFFSLLARRRGGSSRASGAVPQWLAALAAPVPRDSSKLYRPSLRGSRGRM